MPRPGHADLAGAQKFGLTDVRNALERASARQTAATVARGVVAKALLSELDVEVAGRVLELGGETDDASMRAAVDAARADRDTLGGVVEVRAVGFRRVWGRTRARGASRRPLGRGTHVHPGRQGC